MSLEYVSVSQIKMFQRCPRLWWRMYGTGRLDESSDAMELGKRFHAEVEESLIHGRALPSEEFPELEDYTQALLDHFDGYEVEVPVSTVAACQRELPIHRSGIELEWAGVPVSGFIDVAHDHGVHDHKTTKNGYKKDKVDLTLDLQMIAYAQWWFLYHPSEAWCELSHGYYFKQPRKMDLRRWILPRPSRVSRGYVLKYVKEVIEPTVERMEELANLHPDWKEVAMNRKACYDYGGCTFAPHKDGDCYLRQLNIQTRSER